LNFSFNLPENMQIESVEGNTSIKGNKDYSVETNLEFDRKFEIELSKK